MDCIFCKIVAGLIPAKRLYEDADTLAFPDIHPQAPVHVLLIPKLHLQSVAQAEITHQPLLGKLLGTAADLARNLNLSNGYRLVLNTGADGGQTVGHLHIHILGGRQMHWPPG